MPQPSGASSKVTSTQHPIRELVLAANATFFARIEEVGPVART